MTTTHPDDDAHGIHYGSDEPAPVDPANVKANGTVTLARGRSTVHGVVTHVENFLHIEELGRYCVKGLGDGGHTVGCTEWTLTDYQPAPEPEPEWKPGDVAELVHSDEKVRAIRNEDGEWAASDGSLYTDGGHADFRPLVVLDPADISRAVVADVAAKAYKAAPWGRNAFVDVAEAVLAHLGLTKGEK